MPAQSPPVGPVLEDELRVIGERIRAHRRQQKVSATVAAEAAGLSRVTFHRIERGEPSVTMGAYLSAIDAVGLRLEVRSANARTAGDAAAELPERVRLSDDPELQRDPISILDEELESHIIGTGGTGNRLLIDALSVSDAEGDRRDPLPEDVRVQVLERIRIRHLYVCDIESHDQLGSFAIA